MSNSSLIGRFFGFIWRVVERLIKVVQVLMFLLVLVIVLSAINNLRGGGIQIPDSAALIIAPGGELVEQLEGEALDRALLEMEDGPSQTVVRDVVDSLAYAAKDERIKAVVLLPDMLAGGGLSKQQTIAAAVAKFRQSGKRVIAMADNYDQAQYYFASSADEIYMHDFGLVLIEGFGYFNAYFAEAINKLKVDVNVFRVGQYKSFVEPFLRNDMSAEDKLAAKRWLDGLWQIFRDDIIAARSLEPAAFDAYVNDPGSALRAAEGNAAKAAVDAGLIDGLKSHQEFRDYMIDIVGVSDDKPDSFANIDHLAYVTAMRNASLISEPKPEVAVIVASGDIVDGEAEAGTIGSATLTELIRQAANDENIAAIVLRVDSGGGSMFASEVIADQLEVVRQQGKPIVASMSTLAASGGYYISLPADEIWAAESTISGSIGVGAVMPTFQRSLAELGVTVDGFGTAPLTGQMSPMRELGPDARELIDLSIRSAYDVFIGKVAQARKMDIARVDEIAQGRVWIGTDALEIGLVDKIGGLDEAVAAAASRSGLAEGAYDVKYIERELSYAEQLLLQYARLFQMLLSFTNADSHGLATLFQQLSGSFQNELTLLNIWNDPRGIYYQCFCELH